MGDFVLDSEGRLKLAIEGVSGYSGLSGFSGMMGISGTSGASGFSSQSGTSGVSGFSGTAGPAGSSGPAGESGYSGASGFFPSGTMMSNEVFLASGTSISLGDPIGSFNLESGKRYKIETYGWLDGAVKQCTYSGTAAYKGSDGLGLSIENGSTNFFFGQAMLTCSSTGTLDLISIEDPMAIAEDSIIEATEGTNVYSGFSGFDAQAGYSGPSGYSGVSGEQGTSGFSGYDAQAGYSGPSGYSGESGMSGVSGVSGATGTGSDRLLVASYMSGLAQNPGTSIDFIPAWSTQCFSGAPVVINQSCMFSGYSAWTEEFDWVSFDSVLSTMFISNGFSSTGSQIENSTSGMSLIIVPDRDGWIQTTYINPQSEKPYWDGYSEYSGFSGQSGELRIGLHIQK